MRELTQIEVEHVSGGILDFDIERIWKNIRTVIRELPDAYKDAIASTTEMMCTATGKC